ncbi:glycosyltransferase [Tateyamaria sp. syn59]|uniref:glycosyltransferase n=1 Tax=Tateyamaria sp. syn59 TaxID=2576942 RepID=UPI001CB8CA61|nr:glycosyltransferase [Tateyamaria sp. syn59]
MHDMKRDSSFLHEKFLSLLNRPTARKTEDFREYLLSRRQRPHRIGFKRGNLNKAFSANLPRLFHDLIAIDESRIDGDAPVLMYGAIVEDPTKSHDSTKNLLPHVKPKNEVLFFEMGFLASTTSWSEALASKDPRQACLSYIFDDRAQYYMADYESRLDEKLNGDFELSATERTRAENAMRRIVDAKISKYNSQPFFTPEVSPEYSRRVLVVDQNFSDASTIYGRASSVEFEAMLEAAIAENPDAEILIKTHPDLNWVEGGKRRGYFDHLSSEGRIRILREGINPFELFDLVDKVYVGTSGMGLEALLAGKQVICFGAPCYAGWGLTDDRAEVPHRHRTRDLVEFFHAFYIWYTIYHLPTGEVPAQIEDVLDFIEENRPVQPIPQTAPAEPLLSIIIPVHGVERYIAECLRSIQRQSFKAFEVILIDDVSPDNSVAVIEEFSDRDPRFQVVRRKENAGPGFVRNQGIDLARGRYVLFIDPDDYMPDPAHLARVLAMAEADQADMVRYRKVHEQVEDSNGDVLQVRRDNTEAFFPQEVRRTSLVESHSIAHSRHFWNWLYRREFLYRENIRFLTTYREERAFLLQAYMADPVISLSDSDGVVYRIRPESAVRRAQTMADVRDQLLNFDLIVDQLGKHGAFDPASPYWWLARFQVSQFLHYLYFGFAWKTAQSEQATDLFLDKLSKTLARAGIGSQDLIADPSPLSRAHLRANAYGLLLAATLLRREDYIKNAIGLIPIGADRLYDEFLHEPESAAERDLQRALSLYARNDRVAAPATLPEATPDRPRLILHLGATKTGSTLLQHLLEDNRPELLRAGIWYPEVGLFWQEDRQHKQAGHARFMEIAASGAPELRQHILNGLSLMKGRIHTIILSSEAFFLNPKSLALPEYFEDFPTEMVVYLRRQDEWANSQYAEFVAGGAINAEKSRFSSWLEKEETKNLLDYDRLVRSWEQLLPKSALHIRRYQRVRGGTWSIIDDFSEATRLPQISTLPPPFRKKGNDARLSATHVELIRQFNKRPFPSKNAYLNFIEEVVDDLNAWREKKGFAMPSPWFLTDEIAEDIMMTAAPGNDRIARDYFGLSGGRDLFPPRAEQPEDCPVYLPEFDIVESAYASRGRGRNTSASTIVNYGLFSWRLWSSIPLLTLMYRRKGRADLARELQRDPNSFSRNHWLGRRPVLRWLAYSRTSTLGPHQILRVWIPALEPLVRKRGGKSAVDRLHEEPVAFVRSLRNPIARAIGRLLFPMGDRT